MSMDAISIERVYDYHPGAQAGRPVLVDRIWPRGKSKADLQGVLWLKEVAPSTELRRWFGHRPERWPQFKTRYFAELGANPAVAQLRELLQAGPVTLLYGARDETHNQAAALREYLGRR